MRKKLQIIALVLFSVLSVCLLLSLDSVIQFLQAKRSPGPWSGNPYYYLATTVRPRSDDLAGKYLLAKQELTVEGMDFLQGQQAAMELMGDGSYSITNLPLWEQAEANRYNFTCGKLISTTGHWRVIDLGRGKGKQLWGLELRHDSGESLSKLPKVMVVTNEGFPHGLFFDLGDEERILVMFYERARSK